jgi:hypothetical protein
MIKFLFAILFLSFISNAVGQTRSRKFEFIEKSYGIYKSHISTKDATISSTSVEHSVLDGISLVKKTQKITAILGVEFGVEYFLKSSLNDTIPLEIEWIYPKDIIDPASKKKVKSIRYGINLPVNFINNGNYTLEKPFEVVKGNWKLNIYYKNKVIYRREFILE